MLPEPFMLGLLLFQVLYSLVQWYFFRRKEYLYYAAYSITVGIYFFLKYNSGADEIVRIGSFSFNELMVDKTILFIAFYFYIEFAFLFLINTSTGTRLYKTVTVIKNSMLAYAIIIFAVTVMYKDFSVSIRINFFVSAVSYLACMGVLYFIIKKKIILGPFLAAGSLIVALGALLSVILGYADPYSGIGNRNVIIYFQAGVILELIILNTGLVYKTKLYAETFATLSPAWAHKGKDHERKISNVLQTMRKEISYELQTEIGDGLSGIRLMSEMAKKRMGDNYMKELERISENSERLVQSMNEILWSLNHTNDDLPGLISYIREYAMNFMEQVGIACDIEMPEKIIVLDVAGDVRRNIFLAVKEALHNVVKHAGATCLNISFSFPGKLQITIADNGKGMPGDAAQYAGGNGLKNMAKRMELLHGKFLIDNKKGTIVTFIIPFAELQPAAKPQ